MCYIRDGMFSGVKSLPYVLEGKSIYEGCGSERNRSKSSLEPLAIVWGGADVLEPG